MASLPAGDPALSEVVGEDANDRALRTGDLRHVVDDPGGHICRMFRWSDVQALVERTDGRILDGSASNWASLGDAQALTRLEADADRWSRFIEHEAAACAQSGARDGGTHILFAASRASCPPRPLRCDGGATNRPPTVGSSTDHERQP